MPMDQSVRRHHRLALPGFFCIFLGFSATLAFAVDGRSLFESTQLGTSGQSCSTCHLSGKGLDKTGDFTDSELKDIINACIRDALKGSKFAEGAPELDALMHHVRTFQQN